VKPAAVVSAPDSSETARTDLAGALHEVSNSLTVVLGWLDAAKNQIAPGTARDALEVALAHARLGHAIARRAIGAEIEDESSVTRSAMSVAHEAVLGVKQEADRKQVEVIVKDRAANDLLIGNSSVVQQILVNLLLNAVQFSPRAGAVVLSMHGETAMSFRVADSGPGIAPERLETLFSSPDSTRPGGAGIGLRHAHALAATCGGVLSLARTDASGSEFELLWPIAETPSRAHRTSPLQSLDGLRVLLLEDDPAVRTLVDLGLTARGAEVATASTLPELTALVQRGVFDVAMLDLSPLGAEPDKALQLIQNRQRGLPVVIISGSVAPDVGSPSVAGWVRKPFEVGELVEALVKVRGQ
jgi:CheY-like chemotaxis protein